MDEVPDRVERRHHQRGEDAVVEPRKGVQGKKETGEKEVPGAPPIFEVAVEKQQYQG